MAISGACGYPALPELPAFGPRVAGQLRGLWDGADGVALRLQADGVDTLLTVSANGAFRFDEVLAPGASYSVTVATNPVQHSCVVDRGGNGTIGEAAASVSVACTGPAVAVALTGSWPAAFDPTEDTQTFSASVLAESVALTVTSDQLTSVRIAGNPTSFGTTTAPIALPLGSLTVPIALTADGGLSKTYQLVFRRAASLLEQVAYGKASNTNKGDGFGTSVALSGDTLAVGAYGEASAATGVNGNQVDNSAPNAGAVYVFVRTGTTWTQQAYLKASNTDAGDVLGWSVSLSGDTLAVSAIGESSAATGVNGNQADNSAPGSGAIYVFVRSGTSWSQQAYLKASNTDKGDSFGYRISLSGDTLAVGANAEASAASGVDGNQADNSAVEAGAVYVFVRSGTMWSQQAYLKPSNTRPGDSFGGAVALSGDTLAVGAIGDSSAATGVNGDQADTSERGSGAAYVFVRSGTTWSQQAYVKASNTGAGDDFGSAVAVEGDTLAVGAGFEGSKATGVDGNQADNSAPGSGAVYVYVRSGTTWSQQAYLKASNTGSLFGDALALSGDNLAVGAYGDASSTTGINGSAADRTMAQAGAVYLFNRSGTSWSSQAYIKASRTGSNYDFGVAIALSGATLVAGAVGESSAATGFGGNQADTSASFAGAIYVFR